MAQIYKKILISKGILEKRSLTPNPSPNGEGSNYRDTPLWFADVSVHYYLIT